MADPSRRRILDILKRQPGATVGAVCSEFDISRIAVMKHINVLESAGLVRSEKNGRERNLWLDPVPLQRVIERWLDAYGALFASTLTGLKRASERRSRR